MADPNAGMGIAEADFTNDGRPDFFVTNSRGQTHAVYASANKLLQFNDVRAQFTPALEHNLTGWGDSWVDLNNDGTLELVVANGAIPVTNLKTNAAPAQVLVRQDGQYVDAGLLRGLPLNGRGLAAADFDHDGRVDFAINSIGGPLVLLHNTGPSGHWLDVDVRPFSPGAIVTVESWDGTRAVREIHAGSSYLSSEAPNVHFGLGKNSVRALTVRYPDGVVKRFTRVPIDQTFVARR